MVLGVARVLYVTITFALVNDLSMNVLARDNRRKTKEKGGGFHANICDITDRDSKVHCYCENTREPRNATKAECWIFNGGIKHDDLIWQSFASQPTLQTLSFNVRVDGALDYIPTKALYYLQKLRSVNVKYGNIAEVTPYALANLTNLREATLSQNQIEHLHPYAFAHLPNITIINLEENMILDIGIEVFYNVPKLQKLVLTRNNISSIQDGAFQHTYNLLELDLNKNNLLQLNRHTFDGLANLRTLNLRRNRVFNLTEFTFAELWNLQELLLGKNDIKFISERAFDGLSQLRKLSLDDNKLVSLPPRLFEGVRGLSSLDLRSNKLRALTLDNIKPIMDNLKPQNSNLLIEDNHFVCDCRLKWMHIFRNDTFSQNTRKSLDNVTCQIDIPIVSSAYNKMPEKNNDYNLEIIDARLTVETLDEIYNKTVINTAPELNKEVKYENVKQASWDVMKMSAESLPCPQEVTVTTTEPTTPVFTTKLPVQNEMQFIYRLLDINSSGRILKPVLKLNCIFFLFFFT